MAIVYPAGIDSFAAVIPGPPGVGSNLANANPALVHSRQTNDANDAIVALETKLGIDGSPAPGSIDGRVTALETGVTTTIAALIALRDASGLEPGATYLVTDWVSGTGSLPGPNTLIATATGVDTLSTSVGVETPYGLLGPTRGEFVWDFGIMSALDDSLGNHITDLQGFNVIDKFPWGSVAWSGNTINDIDFIGGFTVTSAAQVAGFAFSGNTTVGAGGSIDLTGTTGGSITGCLLQGASAIVAGAAITATTSQFIGSTVTSGTAGIAISDSVLVGSSVTNSSDARGLALVGCTMESGSITESRGPAIAGTDSFADCTIQQGSSLVVTGTVDPGMDQTIANNTVAATSAVTLTDAAGSFPLRNTEVRVGTLNVTAGGSLNGAKVYLCTLNTGAFAHSGVIVEKIGFTLTLTAANTNTYSGFGATTII